MGKLGLKTLRALITAVCVTMPDAQVLAVAKAVMMKPGGTRHAISSTISVVAARRCRSILNA